jgi:integrase
VASAHRYSWSRADGSSGKGWRAKWTGSDGRQHSKRGFDRKTDALTYATDREAEARHGLVLAEGSTMTVGQWADRWLRSVRVKPASVRNYTSAVKRIKAGLGSRQLGTLRESEVAAWRKALTVDYAESTAANTATILGMVLQAAVRDRLIEESPMPRGARTAKREQVDPERVLTTAQVQAWADALPENLRPMPLVAAQTGLRLGELAGLRPSRIDFLGRQVHVVEQLLPDKTFGSPKTEASVRVIPLTEQTGVLLAEHLRRYPVEGDGPVFRSRRGTPLARNTFWEAESRARQVAGLPEWVTWHSLRTVYASSLIHLGLDLRLIMTLLGHTSSEETLGTYGRLWPAATDGARKALEGLWSASEGHQRATSTETAGQKA